MGFGFARDSRAENLTLAFAFVLHFCQDFVIKMSSFTFAFALNWRKKSVSLRVAAAHHATQ